MDEPRGLDAQLELYRSRQKRSFTTFVLMLSALGAAVWFLYGFREEIRFAFSSAAPTELGDVAGFDPASLEHNSFVRLAGITEHRGLTQQRMRGLSLTRQEFWYFRLAGGGGLFVEVPADKELYGTLRHIEVLGRVVDPRHDPTYRAVAQLYMERFHPQSLAGMRVVQHSVVPGSGRAGFAIAFAALLGLATSNSWVLVQLLRTRAALLRLRR
jgi:hypothetical protein